MRRRAALWLAAGACALSVCPAVAEVAAVPDGAGGIASVVEMTDRATTPPRIWSPTGRAVPPALVLNPRGDQRGDGPPSIARNPITRMPEAVWSYWDGHDYEIAWSRFEPGGWTPPVFLSDDAVPDLDPRLHIDAAGNRRVVSWRDDGVAQVVLRVRPANDQVWWEPQILSAPSEPTRWPDVLSLPTGTFVAAVVELEDGAGCEMTIFESPLNGDVPQRTSDPWGRSRLRSSETIAPSTTSLLWGVAAGGPAPVLSWREGNALAATWYDVSAGQWAAIALSPWPIW